MRSVSFLVCPNNMKLLYFANMRLPTEKAHGIQIMKMLEAFSEHSETRARLIVPRRINKIKKDPFEYYGVARNFTVTRLPTIDLLFLPFWKTLWFFVESIGFAKMVFWYALFHRGMIPYTRDFIIVAYLSFLPGPFFYEIHMLPERIRWWHSIVFRRCSGLVVISRGLKQALFSAGVPEEKILVAPDAADIGMFNISLSKEESRRTLHLSPDKTIVLYTGHLYGWKGAQVLADAARELGNDVLVYIVGGTEDDIRAFRSRNAGVENLVVTGHRPHGEMPIWLKAADLLVLPTSGKEKIGREYTSPMKLFEYMASGTPIIASDVPSIREVLTDDDAVFFAPDDREILARAIKTNIAKPDALRNLAAHALQKANQYTWKVRATRILSFLGTRRTTEMVYKDDGRRFVGHIFTKTDFARGTMAGGAIALLGIPILKNIGFFEVSFVETHRTSILFLWLVALPAFAVGWLYIASRLSARWPAVFEVSKYGLIGSLNTVLSAGIFNFLILVTGIAKGFVVDIFFVIAFAITITHSFFWNKFWTFKAHDTNNGKMEYVKFLTVTTVTSIINVFLLHIIVNTLGAPAGIVPKVWANIAFATLIPVSFLGNFFGYKIFVFTHRSR